MNYASVLRLPQYFRNFRRLREILSVLARLGFGDFVSRMELSGYLPAGLQRFQASVLKNIATEQTVGERVKRVCEELGATFIKFAQVIATRPDIFPAHITEECRKLQDTASPFDSELACEIIARELKCPLEDIFASFDPRPIAAASIGQIHRATLRDGTQVVVKVQRPNLDRLIDSDVDIMRGLAVLVEEHLPEARSFSPVQLVEEFGRNLKRELDFRREASNVQRFQKLYAAEPNLVIPRIFPSLTTQRILVEEYIDGFRADDVIAIDTAGIDRERVVNTLSSVVLTSIFEHRFFHADPHPGNVLVLRDGRVALIDFGAMGRLDNARLQQTILFLVATMQRDPEKMIRVLRESQMVSFDIDESTLKIRLMELVDLYLDESLGSIDLSRMLSDIFEVVRTHGVRPPPDLLLVGKALTTVEFIGAQLDPNYQPVAAIRPYLMQQYAALLSNPKLYVDYTLEITDTYRRFLTDFPEDLRLTARQLSRGELKVKINNDDMAAQQRWIGRCVNRAVVIVAGVLFVSVGAGLLSINPAGDILAYTLLALGFGFLLLGAGAIARSGGL